jgi:hypothetical protein
MVPTSSQMATRLRRWAPGCILAGVLMLLEAVLMALWMLDSRGH